MYPRTDRSKTQEHACHSYVSIFLRDFRVMICTSTSTSKISIVGLFIGNENNNKQNISIICIVISNILKKENPFNKLLLLNL
jgi:hypothetical protein